MNYAYDNHVAPYHVADAATADPGHAEADPVGRSLERGGYRCQGTFSHKLQVHPGHHTPQVKALPRRRNRFCECNITSSVYIKKGLILEFGKEFRVGGNVKL